jgi:pyruvyltransferase
MPNSAATFIARARRRLKRETVQRLRDTRIPIARQDRRQALIDDYVVSDLITNADGSVPVNYFTYRENFGDLLSPWLVKKMTGHEVKVANRKKPHYVVIGSIVNQGTDQSIYWGTGMYGTEGKAEAPAGATYTALRGPLAQAKLSAGKGFGISTPEVYGDPALLLPFYYSPKVAVTHEFGVVVRWSERSWAEAEYGPGVKLIDFSRGDIEAVIKELLSCRKIVTSSLHGLIVADTYGIPSAWLKSKTPRGGVFKFYDYFASVNKFRRAQTFDPTTSAVTVERLRKSFEFSGEAIDYDFRPLLDVCPFLKRKSS